MSKGIPIAQRPDLKDANLSTRLDAVFGSLGPAPTAGGWALRQDVQPFRAGGAIEEYNYSSDEEDPNEGLRPLMPSQLVDSDNDDGADRVPPQDHAHPHAHAEEAEIDQERNEARAARERERMLATLSSRRAFEAEAEEDEYDRVATGTMDLRNLVMDARPPGCTEVPLDSAWERMHRRCQQQRAPQHRDAEQQQCHPEQELDVIMPDAGLDNEVSSAAPPQEGAVAPANTAADDSNPATASRKRFRSGSATGTIEVPAAPCAKGLPDGDVAAVDVEMLEEVVAGRGMVVDAAGHAVVVSGGVAGLQAESLVVQLELRPRTDDALVGPTTAASSGLAPSPQPPRHRGGRRVQWADFVATHSRSSAADREVGTSNDATEGAPGRRHDRSENGANGQEPLPPARNTADSRGNGRGGVRVRLDWQRRGFVPDHVRNPHKYTLYTLDEELVVGGGERSSNGRNGGATHGVTGSMRSSREALEGDDAEMRQALVQTRLAVETTSRVEHDPVRVETTFGRGITFRPRAARRQPQTQQDGEAAAGQVHIPPQPGEVGAGGGGAPDAGVLGAVGRLRGAFVEDAEWGGEEGGLQKGGGAVGGESGEMGMAMEGVAGRGRGRRQFRARQRRDGEEEDGGPEGGAGTSGGEGGAADGESMQHD